MASGVYALAFRKEGAALKPKLSLSCSRQLIRSAFLAAARSVQMTQNPYFFQIHQNLIFASPRLRCLPRSLRVRPRDEVSSSGNSLTPLASRTASGSRGIPESLKGTLYSQIKSC